MTIRQYADNKQTYQKPSLPLDSFDVWKRCNYPIYIYIQVIFI